MTEKKSKSRLLMSLLAPLVEEWGYDTVRRCLAEVQAGRVGEDPSLVAHKRKPANNANRRPSAVEMVDRLNANLHQKESLHALAARFDAKAFLPTAADVRHFLEIRGKDSRPVKQRQEAFRRVLDVLLNIADDELMFLQTSSAHTGPMQLAPLSGAIKATSAAVRNAESHTDPAVAAIEESDEPPIKPADK